MLRRAAATAALVVALAAAALAGGRILPFEPLKEAKKGDGVLYKLDILDSGGRVVSTSQKRYDVDAHDPEEAVVKIGKLEVPEGADMAEIAAALRLLPPGTPTDGFTVREESVALPKDEKVAGFHISLRAKLRDGATEVVFDAWFAKGIAVFGLARARTKVLGGGAGESALEVVDWHRG